MHLTSEQIHFLEIGAAVLIGFALMFWCGWIARDGQVRDARLKADFADSRAANARDCAATWKLSSAQWLERAVKAESRVAELEAQIEPDPDTARPSASAPILETSTGRKRGARGRFIKA